MDGSLLFRGSVMCLRAWIQILDCLGSDPFLWWPLAIDFAAPQFIHMENTIVYPMELF